MRRARPQEPVRCRCMGGRDGAKEHRKPGKTTADHGNPYEGTGACIHSELQHTTKRRAVKKKVKRLRLQ